MEGLQQVLNPILRHAQLHQNGLSHRVTRRRLP
jgi:hypothetical protein